MGELKRSAYRVSADLKVQGGNGGGSELPPSGVPSSLSVWMEKYVSGDKPNRFNPSSTVSIRFSQYTPTWSPVSYLTREVEGEQVPTYFQTAYLLIKIFREKIRGWRQYDYTNIKQVIKEEKLRESRASNVKLKMSARAIWCRSVKLLLYSHISPSWSKTNVLMEEDWCSFFYHKLKVLSSSLPAWVLRINYGMAICKTQASVYFSVCRFMENNPIFWHSSSIGSGHSCGIILIPKQLIQLRPQQLTPTKWKSKY